MKFISGKKLMACLVTYCKWLLKQQGQRVHFAFRLDNKEYIRSP